MLGYRMPLNTPVSPPERRELNKRMRGRAGNQVGPQLRVSTAGRGACSFGFCDCFSLLPSCDHGIKRGAPIGRKLGTEQIVFVHRPVIMERVNVNPLSGSDQFIDFDLPGKHNRKALDQKIGRIFDEV